VQLISIPTELVGVVWPAVYQMIAASCARSPEPVTPEQLLALCSSGKARLLLARVDGLTTAAGVVSVGTAGGETVCEILACAGHRISSWLAGIAEVEAWARYHGATSLRFVGRPGWSRVLTGYRASGAHLTKDI
jgi:hypothetical protein